MTSHLPASRMTDVYLWPATGGEVGSGPVAEGGVCTPPATTMAEVRALIDPEMLIEVEIDAGCASDAGG